MLSHPKLWSEICISANLSSFSSYKDHNKKVAYLRRRVNLKIWLSRSRPSPLTINIIIRDDEDHSFLEEVMPLIIPAESERASAGTRCT